MLRIKLKFGVCIIDHLSSYYINFGVHKRYNLFTNSILFKHLIKSTCLESQVDSLQILFADILKKVREQKIMFFKSTIDGKIF